MVEARSAISDRQFTTGTGEARTMSTETSQRPARRGPFSRRKPDDGPRAKFSQLLPYLLQNKPLIAVVILLSIVGSLATVAQPLLVGAGITAFQSKQPWGLIGALV